MLRKENVGQVNTFVSVLFRSDRLYTTSYTHGIAESYNLAVMCAVKKERAASERERRK